MIQLNNKTPNILVIGDLMVDHYLWGSCKRISPEAPVQIVNVNSETSLLGGAGNVVKNLKTLGAKVNVISVIGNCDVSNEVKKLLSEIIVESDFLIIEKNRVTSKKTRIIADQQQVIRYDCESTNEINQKSEQAIISIFNKIICNYDVVLLSDYGKGVLTSNLTKSLINTAKKNQIRLLVDPKG